MQHRIPNKGTKAQEWSVVLQVESQVWGDIAKCMDQSPD